MKKLFLTLGLAAACFASNAYERILYNQNFETATSPTAAGWTFNDGTMKIGSDLWGKYLELDLGNNNGRSAQVTWGDSIYMDKEGNLLLENDIYKMDFSFCIKTMPNNQYNSEITVFTNHAPIANKTYRLPWSDADKKESIHKYGVWENFIFDASQCNTAVDADMQVTINAPLKAEEVMDRDSTMTTQYTIDTANQYMLPTGTWIIVNMEVNVKDRTVNYDVNTDTDDFITSGTMIVPEADLNGDPISMYAEGLFALLARSGSKFLFDDIRISCEVDDPYANPPTIALTRLGQDEDENLNLNLRSYTISFIEGEVLHIKGTDGQTFDVEYDDTDEGNYVYDTTTSGVLEAWTTCDGATSEVVKVNVECVPCKLPSVVATISSVEAGYGKTYTLTISNADVPLQPTIFINYEFTGVNGEKLEKTGVASGAKVTVSQEGTLKLTSTAFGYEATTTSVENNLEFEVKKTWDFARMTDAEISAAGFPDYQVLNSATTSGFSNWTARKRLYYRLEGTSSINDEGEEVWTNVYPFGFISEDNTENVLYYTEIDVEGEVQTNVAGYELFEGLNVFAGHNVSYIKHVGVYNNATTGGNNKNIDVLNLDRTDFVVINKINNYGGNSSHPVCSENDQYYALLTGENEVYRAADGKLNEETGKYTVSCPVYRIDTAATCITVFKQLGVIDDAVDTVNSEVAGDNYWYSIDGLRVAEPTRPGLYIHNGKKIIVK